MLAAEERELRWEGGSPRDMERDVRRHARALKRLAKDPRTRGRLSPEVVRAASQLERALRRGGNKERGNKERARGPERSRGRGNARGRGNTRDWDVALGRAHREEEEEETPYWASGSGSAMEEEAARQRERAARLAVGKPSRGSPSREQQRGPVDAGMESSDIDTGVYHTGERLRGERRGQSGHSRVVGLPRRFRSGGVTSGTDLDASGDSGWPASGDEESLMKRGIDGRRRYRESQLQKVAARAAALLDRVDSELEDSQGSDHLGLGGGSPRGVHVERSAGGGRGSRRSLRLGLG